MSDISTRTGGHRIGRSVVTVVVAIVAVLVVVTIGFLVWANSPAHGDREKALEVWTNSAIDVTSTDHSVILAPTGESNGQGLVFVPGALVSPYAYMYKLSGLVEQTGTTVVITKPTLNLAFFDQRPLSTFTDDVSGVDTWYVGGHSLGGVRACQMAASEDVEGLILFGSYCANDISDTDLTVVSISGSEDGLSTPDKIAEARHLLPDDATMVEIPGASHASFGDYGKQAGDGVPTISSEEARDAITAILVPVFGGNVG